MSNSIKIFKTETAQQRMGSFIDASNDALIGNEDPNLTSQKDCETSFEKGVNIANTMAVATFFMSAFSLIALQWCC